MIDYLIVLKRMFKIEKHGQSTLIIILFEILHVQERV